MIKAVFIDIDNTLLDFDAYVKSSMKDGFAKFGLRPYEDIMFEVFTRINNRLWREIEQGSLTFEELLKTRWNRIFAELGISFDGCEFEKYFRGCLFDSAIPVEGAFRMLEYLKDRYILCVASNGPYEQQVNRLKQGGMLQYFSHVFVSERVGAQKPSKEFFSHCLSRLNEILPSEIMMIGDSLTSDITGAVNSGLKTCFFNKYRVKNNFDLPIDHVIENLEEIKIFL